MNRNFMIGLVVLVLIGIVVFWGAKSFKGKAYSQKVSKYLGKSDRSPADERTVELKGQLITIEHNADEFIANVDARCGGVMLRPHDGAIRGFHIQNNTNWFETPGGERGSFMISVAPPISGAITPFASQIHYESRLFFEYFWPPRTRAQCENLIREAVRRVPQGRLLRIDVE